jgi:predicted ribosomally synthesized peptide with SipW-like signal peptide
MVSRPSQASTSKTGSYRQTGTININFAQVGIDTAVGGLGGAVTGGVLGSSSGAVGASLPRILASGLAGGAAAGAVGGGAYAYVNDKDVIAGSFQGAIIGGISGMATGAVSSLIPTSWYAAATRNPPLRGTNEPGQATSRPGDFRTTTVRSWWDRAGSGPNGGRLCESCGKEVFGRGTSLDDAQVAHWPAWTNRQFPRTITRDEALDNYQRGVGMQCGACNRRHGNDDQLFPRFNFPFSASSDEGGN